MSKTPFSIAFKKIKKMSDSWIWDDISFSRKHTKAVSQKHSFNIATYIKGRTYLVLL